MIWTEQYREIVREGYMNDLTWQEIRDLLRSAGAKFYINYYTIQNIAARMDLVRPETVIQRKDHRDKVIKKFG